MITLATDNFCREFRGLSTDTKPINENVGNGSIYLEMDTCKVFMFDEKNQKWEELK